MSSGKCCNSGTPTLVYQPGPWNFYKCNCLNNGLQPASPNPSLCCSQLLNATSGTCQCAPAGTEYIMQNTPSKDAALIAVGDACCSGVVNDTTCAPQQPNGFDAEYFSNDACLSGYRAGNGTCR